jgi:hypothetical protein
MEREVLCLDLQHAGSFRVERCSQIGSPRTVPVPDRVKSGRRALAEVQDAAEYHLPRARVELLQDTVGSMCCPTSFLPYEVGGRTARCGCGVQAPALFCDPFQLGYSVVVMVVRVRLDIADVTTPPSFIRTVTLGFRAEELVR